MKKSDDDDDDDGETKANFTFIGINCLSNNTDNIIINILDWWARIHFKHLLCWFDMKFQWNNYYIRHRYYQEKKLWFVEARASIWLNWQKKMTQILLWHVFSYTLYKSKLYVYLIRIKLRVYVCVCMRRCLYMIIWFPN